MVDDRTPREPTGGAERRAVPTAADSWRRNVEILELVNRIRTARERRSARDRARASAPRPR